MRRKWKGLKTENETMHAAPGRKVRNITKPGSICGN